jgi:hypothetical protein
MGRAFSRIGPVQERQRTYQCSKYTHESSFECVGSMPAKAMEAVNEQRREQHHNGGRQTPGVCGLSFKGKSSKAIARARFRLGTTKTRTQRQLATYLLPTSILHTVHAGINYGIPVSFLVYCSAPHNGNEAIWTTVSITFLPAYTASIATCVQRTYACICMCVCHTYENRVPYI